MRLYLDEIVTSLGGGLFWVAYVVAVARDPNVEVLLSAGILARFGPRAVLSAPLGSLVDRVPLRTLLVAIALARATSMTALTVLHVADAPPWTLVACILGYAVVSAPARTATTVALVRVCSERELAGANATLAMTGQVMGFAGPMLGAAVVAWSISAAFVSTVVVYIASALLLASLRGLRSVAAGRERSAGRATRGAVAAVRSVEGLPALLGLVGVMYFLRGTEMVLHVLVVTDLAQAGAERVGVLSGAVGLGALLTAPIAARASGGRNVALVLRVALALSAVPTAAVALTRQVSAAAAVLFFVGVGMVLFEVVSVMTIQRTAPRSELGRVFGVVNTLANGGKLAGAAAAPVAVAVFGTSWALVSVGVVVAAAGALAAPAVSRLAAAADDRRRALEPVVSVLRSLGLFEAAPQAALERIAASVEPCDVSAGGAVVREGEPADDLYVVRRGTFIVTVHGATVNEVRVDEWFGEIGLVRRVPRTATVTATSDAHVWRIPGDVFLAALEDSGAPPSGLMNGIADRLARGAA